MQVQHQSQIVIQLQSALEIFLRFTVLTLCLSRKASFGVNQWIVIVERNALVKIGNREFGITDDQKRAAPLEVSLRVIWIEFDRTIEIRKRAFNVHVVLSNIAALQIGLRDDVIVYGEGGSEI